MKTLIDIQTETMEKNENRKTKYINKLENTNGDREDILQKREQQQVKVIILKDGNIGKLENSIMF